jgi:cell division protein FtsB
MSVKVRNQLSWYLGWLGVFFGLYLIYVLGKGIWEMRGLYGRLSQAELSLEQEKEKRDQLFRQVSEATTAAYVEKVAREELGMSLPGETMIIVNNDMGEYQNDENMVGSNVRKEVEDANWQKWWKLVR